MKEVIDEAQETLVWGVNNNQIYLLLFLIMLGSLIYYVFKQNTEMRKAQENFTKVLMGFQQTNAEQQEIVKKLQAQLEERDKGLDNTLRDISNKLDLMMVITKGGDI